MEGEGNGAQRASIQCSGNEQGTEGRDTYNYLIMSY